MNPMAATLFGATLDKTCAWVNELMSEAGLATPERAYAALRAVLHALRDRLSVDEVVELGAQLPLLVRGLYYEGWRPTDRPLRYRHREEFLQQVAASCPWIADAECEWLVRSVFTVLKRHVTTGEIEEVIHQLPAEVRGLWAVPL